MSRHFRKMEQELPKSLPPNVLVICTRGTSPQKGTGYNQEAACHNQVRPREEPVGDKSRNREKNTQNAADYYYGPEDTGRLKEDVLLRGEFHRLLPTFPELSKGALVLSRKLLKIR